MAMNVTVDCREGQRHKITVKAVSTLVVDRGMSVELDYAYNKESIALKIKSAMERYATRVLVTYNGRVFVCERVPHTTTYDRKEQKTEHYLEKYIPDGAPRRNK